VCVYGLSVMLSVYDLPSTVYSSSEFQQPNFPKALSECYCIMLEKDVTFFKEFVMTSDRIVVTGSRKVRS